MIKSLKQIFIVAICAIVIIFYKKVMNVSEIDIPFWVIVMFICIIVPIIFTIWMFNTLRPKRI